METIFSKGTCSHEEHRYESGLDSIPDSAVIMSKYLTSWSRSVPPL